MRRVASSALVLAAAVLALAGCGGDAQRDRRVLNAFFTKTSEGRHWSARFPHKPGTVACTVKVQGKDVQGRCATDLSLVKHDRAVVTLTETWGSGGDAHTWFFFIRRTGAIESVVEEGAAQP